MASVEKRPNGKWRARWREYPGAPQKVRHFDRKSDATAFLDIVRGGLARGDYIDPDAGRVTFEVFADKWAAAQDWKALSRESWTYHRARLVKILGPMPLAAIDLMTLQATQRKLGETYARSTVTTTMAYAGSVMRAAHASGKVGRDPTRGMRPPKLRGRRAGRQGRTGRRPDAGRGARSARGRAGVVPCGDRARAGRASDR
jgi:hypothetical protein